MMRILNDSNNAGEAEATQEQTHSMIEVLSPSLSISRQKSIAFMHSPN